MAICVGCGLTIDAGLLTVQTRPSGGILCQKTGAADDGLYMELVTASTNCITNSGGGTGASPLTTAINLSEDARNGLDCRGNGLWSLCPDSVVCSMGLGLFGASFPVNANAVTSFNVISNCSSPPGCATCATTNTCAGGSSSVQITLPADAGCIYEGFWEIIGYGGNLEAPNNFEATMFMSTCTNNAGFVTSLPKTNTKILNYTGATRTFELGQHIARDYIAFAPGQSHTFAALLTLLVGAAGDGSAQWGTGVATPQFEFYIHLTQKGCC